MISALVIVFSLAVLGFIGMLLLQRKLREKYALFWLVIGLALLVLALFPSLLAAMANAFGVEVPSNLLFALSIVMLVGVTLQMTWELSTVEDEARRLSEEAAIARADIEALNRRLDALTGAEDPPASNHTGEAPADD